MINPRTNPGLEKAGIAIWSASGNRASDWVYMAPEDPRVQTCMNYAAAALATVEPAQPAPDAKNAATELFNVESIHHIQGHECLCGFKSAVSRDRTKHIMDKTLKAIGWAIP